MKRHILAVAFLVLISAGGASVTPAQHGYRLEKSLKFAAGKFSKTVKGRIAGEQEKHEYKFKARAGQTLSVKLTARNRNLTFMILDAGDAPIGSAALKTFDWTGELPSSGKYRILVYSLEKTGNYALYVSVK